MSLSLLEYLIGNTVFALPLALLAWSVGRTQRHPGVAHLLWALVLVRLLLPPIAAVPWLSFRMPLEFLVAKGELLVEESGVLEISSSDLPASGRDAHPFRQQGALISIESISVAPCEVAPRRIASMDFGQRSKSRSFSGPDSANLSTTGPVITGPVNVGPISMQTALPGCEAEYLSPSISAERPEQRQPPESFFAPAWLRIGAISLLAIWAIGSAGLIVLAVSRVLRFRSLLRHGTKPGDQPLQHLAAETAAALGSGLNADVLVTNAQTPPFVWWLGTRPQIVLPTGILKELPEAEQRLVLAHELAHVQRKDHLVRWLEWGAIALLWWNPLAWVARRGLRASEELACDALVLRKLNPDPREYGSCLLSVAEALSKTRLETPSLACTMNAGESLEQRIVLIMSSGLSQRPSLALRSFAAIVAGVALLLGVAGGGGPLAPADRSLEANIPSGLSDSKSSDESFSRAFTQSFDQLAPNPSPDPIPDSSPRPGLGSADQKSISTSASTSAERQPARLDRRREIEKTVDRVIAIDVNSVHSSITMIRDDSVDSVRIIARLQPSSDKISDQEFAGYAEAIELDTDRNETGKLKVSLKVLADKAPQDIAENFEGLSEPLHCQLIIRMPKLEEVVVASVNGNLLVEGDVGESLLETVNGQIEARGLSSPTVIESVNGSIKCSLADKASSELHIATVSGNILLSLSKQWQGSLAASTGFGGIGIGRLPGGVKPNGWGERYSYTSGHADGAKVKLEVIAGSIRIERD